MAVANDKWADAFAISAGATSYSSVVDSRALSTESGEPLNTYEDHTGWWKWTPTVDRSVSLSTSGSGGAEFLRVFALSTGLGGFHDLNLLHSADSGGITFNADAGTTYYFQEGGRFGTSSASMTLSATITSPTNDLFVHATEISPTAHSFNDSVDSAAYSTESGEPLDSYDDHSGWWTWTPTVDRTVQLETTGSGGAEFLRAFAVEPGAGGFHDLTQIGSAATGGIRFHASAGVTYYFQVGGRFGSSSATMTLTAAIGPATTTSRTRA